MHQIQFRLEDEQMSLNGIHQVSKIADYVSVQPEVKYFHETRSVVFALKG